MKKRALLIGTICVLMLLLLGVTITRVGNPVNAWRASVVAREYMSHLEKKEYAALDRLYSAPMRGQAGWRVDLLESALPKIRSYSIRSIRKAPGINVYFVAFKVDSDQGPVMSLQLEEEKGAYVVALTDPPGGI